jgi:hypothetical protein
MDDEFSGRDLKLKAEIFSRISENIRHTELLWVGFPEEIVSILDKGQWYLFGVEVSLLHEDIIEYGKWVCEFN